MMAFVPGKSDGRQSRRIGRDKPTSSRGCAGVVSEALYVEQFQHVPTVYITSSKELEAEMKKICIALSSTKLDWEKRVNAAKSLRSLVYAGACEFDEFTLMLQSALPSVQIALKDLRSQVVKETCFSVGFLTEQFGISFETHAEVLLPSLVALLANSAKVVTSCAALTLSFLVQHVQSARLIPLITSNFTSKCQAIRRECYKLLNQLLQSWPTATLARQMVPLQDAVKRGIGDADADARCFARSGFIAFMDHFPEAGSVLLRSLDHTKQKLIRNEMISPTSSNRLRESRSPSSDPPTTTHSHISELSVEEISDNTAKSATAKQAEGGGGGGNLYTKQSARSRGSASRSPVTTSPKVDSSAVKTSARTDEITRRGAGMVKRVSSAPPYSRSSDAISLPANTREDLFADKYEDVPHIEVTSANDVRHFMNRVRLGLSNQDGWKEIKNALKLVRSLLLAGASDYPEFFTLLHELEVHIMSTINHRRSDVILEACVTLSHVSKYLGRGFDRLAECIVPVLIGIVPLTKFIQLTISHFIQNSQTARLVPVITQNITSKNVVVRRACCEFMCQMLFDWPTKSLARSATLLQTAIRHAIHDADPCVRYHARQCFLAFAGHFESHAKLLENSLDANKRKTLQQLVRKVSEDTLARRNADDRQKSQQTVTPVLDDISNGDAEVTYDVDVVKRKDSGHDMPQMGTTGAPSAGSTGSASQTTHLFSTSRGEVAPIPVCSTDTAHSSVTLVVKNRDDNLLATQVKRTEKPIKVREATNLTVLVENGLDVAATETSQLIRHGSFTVDHDLQKLPSRNEGVCQKFLDNMPNQDSSRADTVLSSDESCLGNIDSAAGSSVFGKDVLIHSRDIPSLDMSAVALHTVSEMAVPSYPCHKIVRNDILANAGSNTSHRVEGLGIVCLKTKDINCTKDRHTSVNVKDKSPRGFVNKDHLPARSKDMIVTRIQHVEANRKKTAHLVGSGARPVAAERIGSRSSKMPESKAANAIKQTVGKHDAQTADKNEDHMPQTVEDEDAYDCTKKPYWTPAKDPKDMCRVLRNINSAYWKEREKGLLCLQTRLRDPVYNISPMELRRIADTFTQMFKDTNEKVLSLLLDTLLPLLKRYASMLSAWLGVCLAGTLRSAHQMKRPNTQCLTAILSLLRHSLQLQDQFNTFLKYIVEMTAPNLQVTGIILDYMHDLVVEMTPGDCHMTGDFELALARIIMWLTEPFDVTVRKKSEDVLKSLHQLKPAEFSLALSRLPVTFQDDANMRLKADFRVTPFCYGLFSLSPAAIGYIKAMQFGYPGSYVCEDKVDLKETSPVQVQDFMPETADVSKSIVASKSALLSEIFTEFRLSNLHDRRMLRVSALTKLASLLGQDVVWDVPVNSVLSILLATISAHNDRTLQVLAISILKQFLQQRPADLSHFSGSLLRKLLNLHQQSTVEVYTMSDKCAKVLLTLMDIETAVKILCQVVEMAPDRVQKAALGQLTHLIEVNSKENLEPYVHLIASTLLLACDSSAGEVKQAGLVCLATLHWTVGSESLGPLASLLGNIKTRLLNLHLQQIATKQVA